MGTHKDTGSQVHKGDDASFTGMVYPEQQILSDMQDAYPTSKPVAEGQLRENEKMTFLGQMTGAIAHEVNNVMSGIRGYSELLTLQDDLDSEVSRGHVKNIIDSTDRVIAVLQDVLALSGRYPGERKAINLNVMIPDVLAKPEIQKIIDRLTGVTVHLDFEFSLHDIVVMIPEMETALTDLLSVSLNQAGPDGFVSISTRTVYLGRPLHGHENVCEGEYVVLSIVDTGDGIGDDDARHVFEPFYVRKVIKTGLTGLELTTAREIIKDHNGFIDIRSKLGCGSIYTVYLPVLREELKQNRYVLSETDGIVTIN